MEPRFYNGRVCLNVLAHSVENAQEIYELTEGHVIIGLVTSSYTSISEAIKSIQIYSQAIDGAISLGLGSGNPKQWKQVAEISSKVDIAHINQVFPAVGYTRHRAKNKAAFINGLVKPTEKIGYVNIATGPLSSEGMAANIPVQAAIRLIKEMGGNAIKLFPMHGLDCKEQYQEIAKICGEEGFALEPTGGIHCNNFEEIVRIALEAGVPKIIPHVYTAIIDKKTGATRLQDVEKLYHIIKNVG